MAPPTIYYGTFLHHPSTNPSAYEVLENHAVFVDEGGVIVGIHDSLPGKGGLEGLKKQYVFPVYISDTFHSLLRLAGSFFSSLLVKLA